MASEPKKRKYSVKSTTTFTREETMVDNNGVITASKSVSYKVKKGSDSFFRIYVDHIAAINRLTYSEIKFLNAIATMVDWNTNRITFGQDVNKQIGVLASIGNDMRKHCVSSLKKKNILIYEGYLSYMLNPKLFFRGSDTERANVLKLEYRFEIEEPEAALPEKKKQSKVQPNTEFEKI